MGTLYLDINETTYRRLKNIPGLDGVRAISILIVMISHSAMQNLVPGVLGVTIFFFISGFLITSLLLDEHSQNGGIDIPNFYVRRFLRLYPPLLVYIAAIIAALIFSGKSVDVIGLLGALFYFANYLFALAPHHIVSFGDQLWSLSVEEHFYIFFPLLLSLMMPWGGARIALCLAGATFVPLLIRSLIAFTNDPSHFVTYTTVATECRFDSILFGCVTAVSIRQPWGQQLIQRSTHPITVVCALLAMLLTLIYRDVVFRQTLRFTIQNFALISLVLSAIYTPRFMFAKRVLNHPIARWIGVLSYSLYLWHFASFEATSYIIKSESPLRVYPIAWVGSFAVAFLVHVIIEKPIFKMRRRFGSRAHEDISTSENSKP